MSLLNALIEMAQRPSQASLQAPAPSGMPNGVNPLQQSQMQAQFSAAMAGLPQSGFGPNMSMAANPMEAQSPVNPIPQEGMMDILARNLQGGSGVGSGYAGLQPISMPQMQMATPGMGRPTAISPTPVEMKTGAGIMGTPAQSDNSGVMEKLMMMMGAR